MNDKTPDNSKRPVLGLFAHPDDETFGPGSTLAMLADRGHPVHLVCSTRGEEGTIGPSASMGRAKLAQVREAEMQAAARTLGAQTLWILHLPDSGLHRLAEETLVRPFVRAIRAFRPEILITFHENGISGHKDHRTVTVRAGQAFEAAADPDLWPEAGPAHAAARLWTYAVTEAYASRITTRRIHTVPDDKLDAVLDVEAYIPVKRRAIADHASQASFIAWLDEQVGGMDQFWKQECFVLDRARVELEGKRPVADLFAE